MPFVNENRQAKLPVKGKYQVGKTDSDDDSILERGLLIPWVSDPSGSYLYYECSVRVILDSGIVVHNRLPQVNYKTDTLSAIGFDAANLDKIINQGVNLKSNDQYTDIVQRMGHSRYWFNLRGTGIRAGYQVPIPGLVTIGGVPAIPYDKNPQWAYNMIPPGANFGGIPVWLAQWSLWYTTAQQPTSNTIPTSNPSAHITGDTKLPQKGIQSPWSQADDNSVPSSPVAPIEGFITGGKSTRR